jgi:hypothetical protein
MRIYPSFQHAITNNLAAGLYATVCQNGIRMIGRARSGHTKTEAIFSPLARLRNGMIITGFSQRFAQRAKTSTHVRGCKKLQRGRAVDDFNRFCLYIHFPITSNRSDILLLFF